LTQRAPACRKWTTFAADPAGTPARHRPLQPAEHAVNPDRAPASVVWSLGATQIIGYGTTFYSFAILAPDMAASLGWSEQWVFGVLSLSLLAASVFAPTAGRLADRLGAARVMGWGSALCAASLALLAASPNTPWFAVALVLMQAASCLVLYSTAFVAIVQASGRQAALSITHLTLIAGFASTVFWPFTTWLHSHLDWRMVLCVFAALNLLICLPLHVAIGRAEHRRRSLAAIPPEAAAEVPSEPVRLPARRRVVFLLMLLGFAAEGFVLSGVLIHMVPLTAALGLGAAGLWASTLFGPAQVASRLVNMVFGGRLRQAILATVSAVFLAVGLLTLISTTPWLPGALAFMIMFGMGSGLHSIVGGTLPLELFGRSGYGAMVGWASSARQFASAFAPFALSTLIAGIGAQQTLFVLFASAVVGLAAFGAVAVAARSPTR